MVNQQNIARAAALDGTTVIGQSTSGPEYVFKGRTYKTVSGLSKAIFQDSGCDSHSMVVDRVITATVGRKPEQRVVARYTVSAPVLGQPMTVTRQKEVHA